MTDFTLFYTKGKSVMEIIPIISVIAAVVSAYVGVYSLWKKKRNPLFPSTKSINKNENDLDVKNSKESNSSKNYFLGLPSKNNSVIIYHCNQKKFKGTGYSPPGEHLKSHLQDNVNVFRLDQGNIKDYFPAPSVFLIDSPQFNEYTRKAIECYTRVVLGGELEYDEDKSPEGKTIQIIKSNSKDYRTNKYTKDENGMTKPAKSIMGPFVDYITIMRLPGTLLNYLDIEDTEDTQIVWIVFGFTSKGSWCGVNFFTKDNLNNFTEMIKVKYGIETLPKYFEAILKIEENQGAVKFIKDLTFEHFKILNERKDFIKGDTIPMIESLKKGSKFPLKTVHLDPVSGCNFNCEHCIEKTSRNKNLMLSTAKIIDIMADIHRVGCRELEFYGGEPTLHPDFSVIVKCGAAMGFNMMLVTNGSELLNLKDTLIECRNSIHIRVSIDSDNDSDFIRSHGLQGKYQDEFNKIVKVVDELYSEGVSISISYILSEESYKTLDSAVSRWRNITDSFHPRICIKIDENNMHKPDLKGLPPKNIILEKFLELEENQRNGFYFPIWMKDWLKDENGDDNLLYRNERSQLCYSSMYRIGISPGEVDPNIKNKSQYKGFDITDNAFINTCMYRRYDKNTGFDFPEKFKQWWDSRKEDDIKPFKGCDKIICQRVDYNTTIENMIKK